MTALYFCIAILIAVLMIVAMFSMAISLENVSSTLRKIYQAMDDIRYDIEWGKKK